MAFSSLKTAICDEGKTRCLVMSTSVVGSLFLDGYVRISCRVTLLNARDKGKKDLCCLDIIQNFSRSVVVYFGCFVLYISFI